MVETLAEKMRARANHYHPRRRMTLSDRIEDMKDRHKLSKDKRFCLKEIKKSAKLGNTSAYVFLFEYPIYYYNGDRYTRPYRDYLEILPSEGNDLINLLQEDGFEITRLSLKGRNLKNPDMDELRQGIIRSRFANQLIGNNFQSIEVEVLIIKF